MIVEEAPRPAGPYSHAVVAYGFVFVAHLRALWPVWFFIVGEVVFGSGLVNLGYGLWFHRDEPLQPRPQG